MKIAIAGYGIEGEQSYRYYSSEPSNKVTIVDSKEVPDKPLPDGVLTILGEDSFSQLDGFDLIIRTAGLAPSKIKTSGKVWSATNEFFDKCPAEIIGVTGTKGKGTVASFAESIFKQSGRKVWLVGNIGRPALEILGDIASGDIVLYELSSFQLWDIEKSPHVAVVLDIEPDHLNVHDGFTDYVLAKSNIVKYQNTEDVCIYNPNNKYSNDIAHQSQADKKISYGVQGKDSVYVRDNSFYFGDQRICSVNVLQLVGDHNLKNACVAIAIAKLYNIDNQAVEDGLEDFKGLPHRLEFVGEVRGVKYYDDSISTTIGSSVAALRAFSEPKVIILGGSSKGVDFQDLAVEIVKDNVKVILIGENANEIAKVIKDQGFKDFEIINSSDMDGIVRQASNLATKGGVVILSPASASFDMFDNSSDRGEKFTKAVRAL